MLDAEHSRRSRELAQQGLNGFEIRAELAPLVAELERIQDYPRLIVEAHLYGVDLDPQAAEIATVNLMMRAMADLRAGRRRLPLILNQNIKVGNSLIGAAPGDPRLEAHAADLAELRRMRLELASAPPSPPAPLPGGEGREVHDALYQASEAIDARLSAALDAGLARHFSGVDAHRPFHWPVEFPEAFLDEQGRSLGDAGGFQVIVGNPPWEILKPDLREFYAQFDPDVESKLTRSDVERRIAELDAEDPQRATAWQAQKARIEAEAAYCGAAPDYRRQGRGDRATHKLFLERAYRLLRSGSRLGYVVPSGIYTDLGTRELRQMLLEEGNVQYLFSFSNERFFFPRRGPPLQVRAAGRAEGAAERWVLGGVPVQPAGRDQTAGPCRISGRPIESGANPARVARASEPRHPERDGVPISARLRRC